MDFWSHPATITTISSLFAIVAAVVTRKLARSAQREMYPAQVIADLRTENAEWRQRAEAAENDKRLCEDYIHILRAGYVDMGRTPPPYPPGLTA